MKDRIDKRNEEEKRRKSIIKCWNVNYVPVVQVVEDPLAKKATANKEEPRHVQNDGFNETTGSYSGLYGQGEVDDVKKEQVDKILHEKLDSIQDIVDHGGNM